HSGWYPDRQLRFFDRRRAAWNDNIIHESVAVNFGESVGQLKSDILHYTVDSLEQHDELIRTRYAPLGAKMAFERGRRTSRWKLAAIGPFIFIYTYLFRGGFLDGLAGFRVSRFAARHDRLKHQLLWKMQQERAEESRRRS
ncbi:MAG TPA: hypothetical protein VGI80_10415, partial [Pyrinomonadaceae bacterium]